jgi:hypothetical protein
MVLSFSIGSLDPFPFAQIAALRVFAPRLLKFIAISDNQQLDIGASESKVAAQFLECTFVGENKKRPAGGATRMGFYRMGETPDLANAWMRPCDLSNETIDLSHKHKWIYRVIKRAIFSLG